MAKLGPSSANVVVIVTLRTSQFPKRGRSTLSAVTRDDVWSPWPAGSKRTCAVTNYFVIVLATYAVLGRATPPSLPPAPAPSVGDL